ncbi:MAG: glycosyltransferase family 4 protein [Kiritimatiellia bacterium]
MNITQISYHYRPIVGGQEVYIQNLQRVFESAGHRSCVMQPMKRVRAGDTIMVLRLPGLDRLVPGSDEFVFMWSAYLSKQAVLRRSNVIIAHYAVNALLHEKFARKTIVLSHGVEWHMENMQWYDRLHERAARTTFSRNPLVANDTHYLRTMGADIKPATEMFREILPNVWFIPNCVDTSCFRRVSEPPGDGAEKVILVPRQITEDRGIDLAIRSFGKILESRAGLRLCISGKAHHEGYLKKCIDLAVELGIRDKVDFCPSAAYAAMPALYSTAALTLIPTLCREGTSLSALESMSCGTAVVSTNVAGLADLPTVQARPDPGDLAAAVISVLDSREKTAREQQRIVRESFNMANWSHAWLEVIRKVGGNS